MARGLERERERVCVCLLGQVNIWNDSGWRWLECCRRCLGAKWRTIRETLIRCMHADGGRAVFTLSGLVSSAREASDHGARARRQTQAKLRRSWQKNLTDADTRPKGAVTSTHQCYSRTVTADYYRAFPFHVAFSRWSTKQKAFKSCSSADELRVSCQKKILGGDRVWHE